MLIRVFLSLALLMVPFAHAGVSRSMGDLPKRPDISNDALIEGAKIGLLRRFVETFRSQVRSAADMDRAFFAKSPPRRRAEYREFLKGAGPIPLLEQDEKTLTMRFPGRAPLVIEIPNLTKPDYVIGGVPFTVDLTNSMRGNFENFVRAVKRAERDEGISRSSLVLPQAHAVAGRIYKKLCDAAGECKVIVGAVLGTTIGLIGGDLWADIEALSCLGMYKVGMEPWMSGRCVDWKTNRDLWAAKAINQSLANTMPEGQKVDWSVKGDQSCPTVNPNGDSVFETWMREVIKTKNSKPQLIGDWFYFRGEAKNGQLTNGRIYNTANDSKDDDQLNKAQFILTLQGGPNKALQLRSVQAKNYDKKTSLDPDYRTINLSDANQPGYRDTLAKMQYLAEGAESWFESCIKIAANAQLNRLETRESVQSMMNQPSPPVQPASGDSDAKK